MSRTCNQEIRPRQVINRDMRSLNPTDRQSYPRQSYPQQTYPDAGQMDSNPATCNKATVRRNRWLLKILTVSGADRALSGRVGCPGADGIHLSRASGSSGPLAPAARLCALRPDCGGSGCRALGPDVKALTAFPQVLAQMDQNLHWTTELGEAYYNQPQDVLQAVQVMRRRAQAAGNLQSTPQEAVNYDQGNIVLAPVNPQVVYVPTYNPWAVWGGDYALSRIFAAGGDRVVRGFGFRPCGGAFWVGNRDDSLCPHTIRIAGMGIGLAGSFRAVSRVELFFA